MSKPNSIAIVVLSDANSGSEEALGRVFNALAVAHDCQTRGEDVAVYFQGTGTRWPGVLDDSEHPANGLYEAVKSNIVGASCGCADVFGSQDSLKSAGIPTLGENQIPGTSGLPSVARLIREGSHVITF